LLAAGADADLEARNGSTPAELARQVRELIRLGQFAGVDVTDRFEGR